MKHRVSCHCGQVAAEVEGEIGGTSLTVCCHLR